MTVRSGKFLPVGMRFAAVFELDATGRPKASSATAYTGLRWSGPLAFDMTVPQARIIPHPGADRNLRTSILPSQESASAVMRVSDFRFDIRSVLSGILVGQVGEAKEMPIFHSRAGYEPTVALLLYQQSQDLDSGLLTWHSYIVPKCRVIESPGSMNNGAGEISYQIAPTATTQRLWGKTLTSVDDGYLDAGIFEYDSEGKPAVVGFKGDGVAVDFLFPVGEPALSVGKIEVYKNGVKITTGMTPIVTKITFTVAPLVTDIITVWYEI
ncbi:MAG: hypothetical protein WC837_04380 [Bellilinea sp.]